MLRTLLCDEANQFLVVEDPSAISDIVQHKNRHLWLDLEAPSLDDFQMLAEEFNLHPLALEDAMARHQRPKIEQYENFYLVVFYLVGIQDVEQGATTPGRRGLKGTRFHMAGGRLREDAQGITEPLDIVPAPAAARVELPIIESMQAGGDERIVLRELTMFMGENFLVTVHTDPMPELDEIARRWRQNVEAITGQVIGHNHVPGARPLSPRERSELKRSLHEPQPYIIPPEEDGTTKSNGKSATEEPSKTIPGGGHRARAANAREQVNDIGILLYSLLDTIVDDYFPVIDGIVDRVEDLEEQIFERYSQGAIESIFNLKKDLLALRKVLAPERDVLNVLTRRDLPIFEPHTLVYFQDIYDHLVRVTDSIDTYRDLLSSALDSYLSMQSNRLNVTVQTLTSVSIILMSVAAISGWYGMNFQAMPELQSRFGYPGVIATVILVVTLEVIFFKRRRWL
jgi:Mg2+ and Co2+ transporter CorA